MRPSELRALAASSVAFIAPEKPSAWRFAAQQYRSDASIKLLTELAIAGTLILSFLSPPSLPEFPSLRRAPSAQSSATPPSFAASLPPFPSPTGVPLDRTLFERSSSSLRPLLNRAADALKERRAGSAAALLSGADPRDPNVMLLSGIAGLATGGPGKVEEATTLLRRAAEAGQHQAAVYLALIHLVPVPGFPNQKSEGTSWLERAAASGRGEAARLLGQVHASGLGGTIDFSRAADAFRRGADLGDAESMAYLGLMRLAGVGIGKDPAEAEALFHRAARGGNGKALFSLGMLTLGRYAAGWPVAEANVIEPFEKAMAAGEVEAAFPLGLFFMEQIRDPARRDPVRATGLFRRCADAGIARCRFAYATSLELGVGVARDPVKAYAYYMTADPSQAIQAKARLAKLDAVLTSEQKTAARQDARVIEVLKAAPPANTMPLVSSEFRNVPMSR